MIGSRARRLWTDRHLRLLIASALGMLVVGTSVYVRVEDWSVIEALYFCVVSLLTVGLGDIAPETTFGRVFTMGYLLCGVGLVTAAVRIAVQAGVRAAADEVAESV